MAFFQLPSNRQPDGSDLRFIPMRAPARPRFTTAANRARSEASPAAGASLTLGFLIAGAFIVAALTFWSGPESGTPESNSGDQASLRIQGP